MVRFNFIIILIGLAIGECMSQRQSDNWYFGVRAALNFTDCDPVSLPNSSLYTNEGTASISNVNGMLLFYTDGIKVWDRQNNIMVNGTGLFGAESSTNSAVIVPQPGNDSMYFIFTIDDEGGNRGLRYSVVNMNGNGGLGIVINKNILLLNNANEKITAVLHYNNNDIWIITRAFQSDKYYSWLVSATGISGTPVISSTPNFMGNPSNISRGYLKASPNRRKLVSVYNENTFFEISDFNCQTGTVSNTFKLSSHPSTIGAHYFSVNPYGVEFSPSNQFLYISSYCYNTTTGNSYINQYNISIDNPASIANSVILIDSGGSVLNPDYYNHCALQLAKNGRIYVAEFGEFVISAINNPNQSGAACNFQPGAVFLGGNRCQSGLPTFIQSVISPDYYTYDFTYNQDCSRTVSFSISTNYPYDSIRWYFDGLSDDAANTAVYSTASHTYLNDDTFNVRLVIYNKYGCENKIDTILKPIIIGNKFFDLGSNKIICERDTILLDAFVNSGISYLWNTGQTSTSIKIFQAGLYYCDVQLNGCVYRDSIKILLNPLPLVTLGIDTSICEGQTLLLNASYPNATYLWQNGSTGSQFLVEVENKYYVSVSSNGCTSHDTINVGYKLKPKFDLGNDQLICNGQIITLKPNLNPLWQFVWNDGTTNKIYVVTQPGKYSITATNECGNYSDEIEFKSGICRIHVPGSFSPNGDDINDQLKVLGTENIQEFDFRIYNRYGQMVFQTKDKNRGWDGKNFTAGMISETYVWFLNYKDSTQNNKLLKGTVLLIR